jgi:hypothetical protein
MSILIVFSPTYWFAKLRKWAILLPLPHLPQYWLWGALFNHESPIRFSLSTSRADRTASQHATPFAKPCMAIIGSMHYRYDNASAPDNYGRATGRDICTLGELRLTHASVAEESPHIDDSEATQLRKGVPPGVMIYRVFGAMFFGGADKLETI